MNSNIQFEKLMDLFLTVTVEQTVPAHYKDLNFWYAKDEDEEFFQIHHKTMYEEPVAYVVRRSTGSTFNLIHDEDSYKNICNKFPELCE